MLEEEVVYTAYVSGTLHIFYEVEDIICEGQPMFKIDDKVFKAPSDMHITEIIVPSGFNVGKGEPIFVVEYD